MAARAVFVAAHQPRKRFTKRVNSPYTLVMFSTGETKLPYEPCLALAWVCTEAVHATPRTFILGWNSLSAMTEAGDLQRSVRRGRLQEQMRLNAHVQLIYKDDTAER